jgi:hypothetical protein
MDVGDILGLAFCPFGSSSKKGLKHLTSLQGLTFHDCPKLKHVLVKDLPVSLSTIRIYACPLLKKRWLSGHKVPAVDHIEIDCEEYIG